MKSRNDTGYAVVLTADGLALDISVGEEVDLPFLPAGFTELEEAPAPAAKPAKAAPVVETPEAPAETPAAPTEG